MPINEFKRSRALHNLKEDKEFLQAEAKKRGEEDEPMLKGALNRIEELTREVQSLSITDERLDEIDRFLMSW